MTEMMDLRTEPFQFLMNIAPGIIGYDMSSIRRSGMDGNKIFNVSFS